MSEITTLSFAEVVVRCVGRKVARHTSRLFSDRTVGPVSLTSPSGPVLPRDVVEVVLGVSNELSSGCGSAVGSGSLRGFLTQVHDRIDSSRSPLRLS